MNTSKHLKKKKILIQFSDGSSSSLFCYINKKELLVESDIKSSPTWNNSIESLDTDKARNNNLHNYYKLFTKTR